MKSKDPIPVTVLTGFLGAGKTTLLNHLLTQPHGYKCAIIINEFGSINIDNQLIVGADEEIVDLSNGCLCCRVRGDLIKSVNNLLQKQKRFDYIIVETTGLADPSPLAHTFYVPDFGGKLRLDAIVTVADAKHLESVLDKAPEARAQIAFADVVLLNKTDLVSETDLQRLEQRIHRMTPLARIHRTDHSQIDVGQILNLRARDMNAPIPAPAEPKPAPAHVHDHTCDDHCDHGHEPEAAHVHDEHCGHDHDHDHDHGHEHHVHDDSVRSFYIAEERALDLKKAEAWLSELLSTKGEDIYRSKGILHIKGQPKRVVFQGVQMMFDAKPDRFWNVGEKRQNQLVFIGKELDEAAIRAGFATCIAE